MEILKSRIGQIGLVVVGLMVLVLGFQNCGPGMSALNSSSNSSTQGSGGNGSGGSLAKDVNLAWDANTEPELAGYVIHYGTQMGGPYGQSVDVGMTTSPTTPSYKISGLDSTTTYYFVVTAYNGSHAESSFSNEVSK